MFNHCVGIICQFAALMFEEVYLKQRHSLTELTEKFSVPKPTNKWKLPDGKHGSTTNEF